MENVMLNGFAELSVNEMDEINGGEFPWEAGKAVGEELGKFIYNCTH